MLVYTEIAGINYEVEIDVQDEYVCDVMNVSVWDGKAYHGLNLSDKSLERFYEANEDLLNEEYRNHQIALAETCLE